MAAEHAAFKERERTEPVPDMPEPLASKPRDGVQRGREIAARYCENLALRAAAIAFGEGTKSLHTRVQCMQLLWNMVQEVPELVPAPPENGRDQAING
jgi:hypothetical protein